MAGGSHPKSSTHKPSTSSSSVSHRKSRWDTTSSSAATTNNPPLLPQPNSKVSKTNPSPKPNKGPSPGPNATPTPAPAAAPIQPPQIPPLFPFPDLGPPPPPTYGFHMLERRSIVLADGSVRSYLALPPNYKDFPPPHPPLPHRLPFTGPNHPEFLASGARFPPRSPDVLGFQNNSLKRKFEEEMSRHGSNSNHNPNGGLNAGTSNVGNELRAGKQMRIGGDSVGFMNNKSDGVEVNHCQLKKAFLYFAKVINENEADKKKYLEDGKQGRLHCVACGRSSKDFPDVHALVMHTYSSDNADLRVDHLGLHKALCVLMGWNYSKPPDNSKAYQFLPADEAAANQDDLIMWPPMVIIHNTITGKSKDGRLEGLGNRAMDSKIRDLGFVGGKSKSLYGRDGHQGITLVKFIDDQSGLEEAIRLAEHLEKDNHGRKAWSRMQPVTLGKDDEKNLNLVKLDRNGEKNRILYGYLATAADLPKVDFETRKKVVIESQREYKASK